MEHDTFTQPLIGFYSKSSCDFRHINTMTHIMYFDVCHRVCCLPLQLHIFHHHPQDQHIIQHVHKTTYHNTQTYTIYHDIT